MIIVGVTGLICSGKTAVSSIFRKFGFQIFDADKVVHTLYNGELFNYIGLVFPEVIENNRINKKLLAEMFISNDPRWKLFEIHVHKLVLKYMMKFIVSASRKRAKAVLLDIPLLIESGMDKYCNVVVLVKVNPAVRRQRALERGVSDRVYHAALCRQISDSEKCKKVDFIINNGLSMGYTFMQVRNIASKSSLIHRKSVKRILLHLICYKNT